MCFVALDDRFHPSQGFIDPRILADDIAMMVPPAKVIWPMVENAVCKLSDVKQINLCNG